MPPPKSPTTDTTPFPGGPGEVLVRHGSEDGGAVQAVDRVVAAFPAGHARRRLLRPGSEASCQPYRFAARAGQVSDRPSACWQCVSELPYVSQRLPDSVTGWTPAPFSDASRILTVPNGGEP